MSSRTFLVLVILVQVAGLVLLNWSLAPVRSHTALAVIAPAGVAAVLALGWAHRRKFAAQVQSLRKFVESLPDAEWVGAGLQAVGDDLGGVAQALIRTAPRVRGLVERLRLEASHREAILSSMVEGVLAVDHDFKVTFCNQAFVRSIGAAAPIAPNLPLLKLVRDPELLDMLRTVLLNAQPAARRMQLSAAEGHWFEVQAAPMDMPTGRGALAVLHDITQQERLERVRRDFVANVSHEFRTPLTAIRGYAETLLTGGLEDAANRRRFLEIIETQASRLNNIASDLLVLSEIESGGDMGVEPERCHVPDTLLAALRTVEAEAHLRDVHVICDVMEDLEVMGYRLRLEQAFVNLLSNAIKFNHAGGEVRLAVERTTSGQARITVADTGIGIPSADLPRIFERFYRVDKARSRAVGGTGLGLAIVRHVIEQAHGTVTVESQLGKGSSFTVHIPLV
jgi:two-component system phosphate regulon sensor histidine kinase PhoR